MTLRLIKLILKFSAVLSLSAVPAASFALEDDTQQPIHIKANSSEFDNARGQLIYKGNVSFVQGSIEITADLFEIHLEQQTITYAEATGDRASFSQKTRDDGTTVEAFGQKIIYRVAEGKLEILGTAELIQGQNRMSGGEIIYDLTSSLANISGDPEQGDGRMEMIFQPAGVAQ